MNKVLWHLFGAWVMFSASTGELHPQTAWGDDSNRPASTPRGYTMRDINRLPIGDETWNGPLRTFVPGTRVAPTPLAIESKDPALWTNADIAAALKAILLKQRSP